MNLPHARHRRQEPGYRSASPPREPVRSLWDAAGACIADALGPKRRERLHGFMQLIERLGGEIQGLPLHEQVDHVIQDSGLIEHHRREKADRGEARVENLEELVSAARGFT